MLRANLTTTDIHIGTTEDITLGALVHGFLFLFGHPAFAAPVVVTTATTKDIAHDMTIIQINIGLTTFVYLCVGIDERTCGTCSTFFYRASSDRTNLTTAIQAATNDTTIHRDIRASYVTVGYITTTKDVTTLVQQVVTRFNVVQLLYIFIYRRLFCTGILIAITNISIVDGDIGIAVDGTTFTTTIDVTGDGRNTIGIAGTILLANNYVGFTVSVVVCYITDFTSMMTHRASPATTIDVTYRTAFDISSGISHKT